MSKIDRRFRKSINTLNNAQQAFLKKIQAEIGVGNEESGIPVYQRLDDDLYLVSDFLLVEPTSDFDKNASALGIYRLGAGVAIKTRWGYTAAPDERKQWDKPVPVGIGMGVKEGWKPIMTALRECNEEIFVVKNDHGNRKRFVPRESLKARYCETYCATHQIQADVIAYYGNLKPFTSFFNHTVSAYEEWFEWDLTKLENYTILFQEECPTGGNFGINIITKNGLNTTGSFSGQQGWIPRGWAHREIHPAWIEFSRAK